MVQGQGMVYQLQIRIHVQVTQESLSEDTHCFIILVSYQIDTLSFLSGIYVKELVTF